MLCSWLFSFMGMNYACVLLELVRNVLVDEKVLNICLAELRRARKKQVEFAILVLNI